MVMIKDFRTRINAVSLQSIYQPGDGTKYQFNWVEVPLEGDTRRTLFTVRQGDNRSHALILDMSAETVEAGAFYLHPSYVFEKFGATHGYLAKVTAHFLNMLCSRGYWRVLQNLTERSEEERLLVLPAVFCSNAALEAEIELAQPSRVRRNLEAMSPSGRVQSEADFRAAVAEASTSTLELALTNDPQIRVVTQAHTGTGDNIAGNVRAQGDDEVSA